jgi:hypothetical protein
MDLETPESSAMSRVLTVCGARELPYRLDIVCTDTKYSGGEGWQRMNQGGLERLDRYLTDHRRTDLVVIDTWGLFKTERHVNAQHSYDRDVKEIQQLKVLAANYNIGIMLVHHTNKRTGGDWVDSASGTRGLTGSCDTLVNLERMRGSVGAVLNVTGRYVRTSRHRLAFNDKALRFSYVCDADTSELSEARQEVVVLLKGDDPMLPREIADTLNKKPGTIRKLLASMLRSGDVILTDDHRHYTVPVDM